MDRFHGQYLFQSLHTFCYVVLLTLLTKNINKKLWKGNDKLMTCIENLKPFQPPKYDTNGNYA